MYIPGCGVIGNTTDFGSVISGSNPDSLTLTFYLLDM